MKRILQITMCSTLRLFIPPARNALAQWRGYEWGHGPGMMGEYGMGWFGPIIMLVFWIALVVGIVFLIRWLVVSARGGAGREESALEILKRR